jgi:hypothetical protein
MLAIATFAVRWKNIRKAHHISFVSFEQVLGYLFQFTGKSKKDNLIGISLLFKRYRCLVIGVDSTNPNQLYYRAYGECVMPVTQVWMMDGVSARGEWPTGGTSFGRLL